MRASVARSCVLLAAWAVLAAVAGLGFFLLSSQTVVLATHDAVVSPNLSGQVVLHTGPILPDLRVAAPHRVGVDVWLGKTDANSTEQLVRRYAYLASQPEGQISRLREVLGDMAVAAALRGAVVGLLPVATWLLLGRRRRRELGRRLLGSRGLPAVGLVSVVAVLVLGLVQPWSTDRGGVTAARSWVPLAQFVGPGVRLPPDVAGIEVRGDVTTAQTRRLVQSAVDTYQNSKTFYRQAAATAADLSLRQPQDGETVVVLVSDRHDNIGMDAVVRSIADAAGATAVFDAGDDTSSGKQWEAFSLDSLSAAFDGFPRWAVVGNHDNGPFVGDYLATSGWTVLDGEVVDGPGGSRLLGVGDPRSSGLGSWRDETGLGFAEVGSRLADAACAADAAGDRVATILVHDVKLAAESLARGCTDLAIGGHLHVQVGPDAVTGANGQLGYAYTNGTTGGAAYAIAVGSKPRRPAGVSLLTYRNGRPVGVQPVLLQTNGVFDVGTYTLLTASPPQYREPEAPRTGP